jgi:hypothetical protein
LAPPAADRPENDSRNGQEHPHCTARDSHQPSGNGSHQCRNPHSLAIFSRSFTFWQEPHHAALLAHRSGWARPPLFSGKPLNHILETFVEVNNMAQKQVLDKLSEKKDRSVNYLVVEAILDYLGREEKKGWVLAPVRTHE